MRGGGGWTPNVKKARYLCQVSENRTILNVTISLQNIHNVILKGSSTQFKRISEGDTKLRIDYRYCGFGPFCSTCTKLLLSFLPLKVFICIIY